MDAIFPEVHGYSLAESIYADDFSFPAGCIDTLALFGQILLGFFVLIIFIHQAAAKPAAHAGNFRGGQGNTLFFGHFNGDRDEPSHEFRAAANLASTSAHAANDLG